MAEKERPRSEGMGDGPDGFGDFFGGDDDGKDKQVQVVHGPYSESLPVAGMTVGEVRRKYADRFDIDPECGMAIDNQPVDADTKLKPGQVLMFTKRAGVKGAGL